MYAFMRGIAIPWRDSDLASYSGTLRGNCPAKYAERLAPIWIARRYVASILLDGGFEQRSRQILDVLDSRLR